MTELEKLHLIVRLHNEVGISVSKEVIKRIQSLEDAALQTLIPPLSTKGIPHADRYSRSENLLQEKEVDWSVLQHGWTIPQNLHETWYEAIGKHVRRGSSINIVLITNKHEFKAQLLHTNNVLQVRYNSNSEVAKFFQQAFVRSYEYIAKVRKKNGNPHIPVHMPEREQQILQIFRTDISRTLFISGIDVAEKKL